MWVDTVVFWLPALRAAVETFGPDKVMLGSDTPPLPFPYAKSVDVVRALGLPPAEEPAVLGDERGRRYSGCPPRRGLRAGSRRRLTRRGRPGRPHVPGE